MSVHNLKTERMEPGDVYIGRRVIGKKGLLLSADGADGYYGNPYRINSDRQITRSHVIDAFQDDAVRRVAVDPAYRERVKSLHGKRLFCWCHPLPCHGDVLERLAAELVAEDLG